MWRERLAELRDEKQWNTNANGLPEDLSSPAIKAARRLQSLTHGKLHLLAFFKVKGAWFLAILCNGIKLEKLSKK